MKFYPINFGKMISMGTSTSDTHALEFIDSRWCYILGVRAPFRKFRAHEKTNEDDQIDSGHKKKGHLIRMTPYCLETHE